MMGIPIEAGPSRMFCDNEAVYKNASYAVSTLRKKHNSIAYHKVRESVAAGIVVTRFEKVLLQVLLLLSRKTLTRSWLIVQENFHATRKIHRQSKRWIIKLMHKIQDIPKSMWRICYQILHNNADSITSLQ
jgi:hypothetical protein